MTVVTIYVQCPIVKGDICFATETYDDDGLPHTLEHLVFMGSEDYPYKGVLDMLANKSLADGTNAYTDTDHTNYTVSTAGSEGFLNLLPVYLDHLLFPTMTDSAYITEVHHITGKGENAGVVYCEMQACENNGDERCSVEMLRSLYPGKCGYKSVTGGLMENLRTSTTNTKCRNYHKQYYHAKNLCLVVTGPVEANEIFQVIKPIEDKIVMKGDHKIQFERPWQSPVEPLPDSVTKTIQYPSDTDDDGLVYIGFRGPSAVKDFESLVALSALLEYLNHTAVAPIQREFVECPEPYCSSVSHLVIENSVSVFYFSFESVDKDHLHIVAAKLFEVLNKISSGEEKFDLDRMNTILSRKIVRILSAAENSPHSIIIGPVIGHFLYGTTNDLQQRCMEIPTLEKFMKEDSSFWLNILKTYLTSARYVTIVGEPSPDFMRELSETEKVRLQRQKEDLKDELPMLEEKLKAADENNSKLPPIEVLNSNRVPSVERILFAPISRHVIEDTSKVPFRVQYDFVQTNFITIQALLDTGHLSAEERLYLPLISELLFESSIKRDNTLVPYEQIVAELFSDTVAYAATIGISSGSTFSVGTASTLFNVFMQVERSKYEKAVQWYYELLFKIVFTPDRIATVATKMHSDISQIKRSGSKIVSSAMNSMLYQSNCNQWASDFMRQQRFLKDLLKKVKKERNQDVLSDNGVTKTIEKIFASLTQPLSNMFLHLTLKDQDIDSICASWKKLLPPGIQESKTTFDISAVPTCKEQIKICDSPRNLILKLGSIESNYMVQIVKSEIDSYKHPMLPSLYVLITYITQLEGPFWRQLRGLGLTYSYSLFIHPNEGILYFTLAKSTNLVGAHNKALEIAKQHIFEEDQYEDSLLESAKSSLIFELIKREKSSADRSIVSLLAYIRKLDMDYNKELIKKAASVTKDDLKKAGTYLWELFSSNELRSTVCCHPSKVPEIVEGFIGIGKSFEQNLDLDSESFLNSTKLV